MHVCARYPRWLRLVVLYPWNSNPSALLIGWNHPPTARSARLPPRSCPSAVFLLGRLALILCFMLVGDCTVHAYMCREEDHLGGGRMADRRGRFLSCLASAIGRVSRALCVCFFFPFSRRVALGARHVSTACTILVQNSPSWYPSICMTPCGDSRVPLVECWLPLVRCLRQVCLPSVYLA